MVTKNRSARPARGIPACRGARAREIVAGHRGAVAGRSPGSRARNPRRSFRERPVERKHRVPARRSAAPSAPSTAPGSGGRRAPGRGARMRLERQHDAGLLRRSASSGAARSARWPRCTPSKLPIATTPHQASGGVSGCRFFDPIGREARRSARGPGEGWNVGDRRPAFRHSRAATRSPSGAMRTEIGGMVPPVTKKRRHTGVDGAGYRSRAVAKTASLVPPSPRRHAWPDRSARAACRQESPRRPSRHRAGERAGACGRSPAPPRCVGIGAYHRQPAPETREQFAVVLGVSVRSSKSGAADPAPLPPLHKLTAGRRRSSGPCPADVQASRPATHDHLAGHIAGGYERVIGRVGTPSERSATQVGSAGRGALLINTTRPSYAGIAERRDSGRKNRHAVVQNRRRRKGNPVVPANSFSP